MAKKKSDIDNIDDQIEKLKNNKKRSNKSVESTNEEKLEKTTTKEYDKEDIKVEENEEKEEKVITKEFKSIEDTDTKIFDGNNIEDVKDNSTEIKEEKNNKKEDVIIFDRAIDEEGNVDDNHDMSDTFVEDRSKFVKKKRMKKHVKVILIILIILIVLFGVLLGFVLFKDDDKNNTKDKPVERKLTEGEKEDIINKFGASLEKVIAEAEEVIEYDEALDLIDNKNKVKCSVHEIYDDKKIFLDKCSIKGVMTKYSYGEERVIVDNALKVYYEKSTKVATLKKPIASLEPLYEVYSVDCGNSYTDAFLLNEKAYYVAYKDSNGKLQIKNFLTDQLVLESINYTEILPIKHDENKFDAEYVVVKVKGFYGVYKYNGEQIISPMYSLILSGSKELLADAKYVETIGLSKFAVSDGSNYGVIDFLSNRSVIPFEYKKFETQDDFIYAFDKDNNIFMYDFTGKKYFDGYYVSGRIANEAYIIENNNNFYFSEINGKILYDYGIINNIGLLYNSKKIGSEVIFNFVDESTTDKCITISYNYVDGSGTYKNNNTCELN